MLLDPHAGLIAWTIITFVVVLIILKRFAWSPLLEALDERQRRIRDALEGAEQARDEAQAALAEHQKALAGAESEAREIVAQAREAGERGRTDIIDEARRDAEQTVEQALRSIETEKQAALIELRREVADLAVRAASEIVNANLDDERNRQLVDDLIAGVPESPSS
mgnify:FL=1